MSTTESREIPHDEWPAFLDWFSRRYDGKLATLEIFEPGTGIDIEGRALRLSSVTGDFKDGENEIVISAETVSGGFVAHSVASPVRLYLDSSTLATAMFETLVIEARGGAATSIRIDMGDAPR